MFFMKFKLKDPGSSITHFIGMLMALFAATPLLIRASLNPDKMHVISLAIFILSMILLYGASATYHALDLSEKINRMLRKLDHMMIFILIAGTYTPVCLRESWLRLSGLLARNGFLPYYILLWAGYASSPSPRL